MVVKKEEVNQQKENKRQLIINAALRVFSAEGYHKTRMESIAEVAGIGKGTLYEYFASKLDLFKAMIENSYNIYYQKVFEQEMQHDNSLDKQIYELFHAHIGFCQQHWELANILFKEQHSMGEEFKSWMRDIHVQQRQEIVAAIQLAIAAKQIRPVDADVLYQMIVGVMAGLAFSIMIESEVKPEIVTDLDIDDVCDKAREILMQGLALK